MQGHFITFEGIDGAGKSTHIDPLAQQLRAGGWSVVTTREPGGTRLAEQLRQLSLHQDMDAVTEALLMFAARRDHIRCVIEPALKSGSIVLCDRFTDATFAYQGSGRGLDWHMLEQLERMVQTSHGMFLKPTLTLWFDLPAADAAQRLSSTRLPDRFESQPTAFFEAVRAGYLRRMNEDPVRIVCIDANLTIEEVFGEVWRTVSGVIGC
jgi:dTMP kinase